MIDVLLVGAGGFGTGYVKELLGREDVCLKGIVDPFIGTNLLLPEIEKAGVPLFDTMEEFFAESSAELAMIAAPTYLHKEYSICAVSHGCDVLCEKPAAGSEADVREMIEAEKRTGHFIAIGFQWSYSKAIQQAKKDILDGRFGKPLNLATIISWSRSRDYFARGGGWGGSVTKDGKLLLDSIASNACGHYLHNMLFLCGPSMTESASAVKVSGSCLRANKIENFDTCILHAELENGAVCHFIGTHASGVERDPEFVYRFEKGVLSYGPSTNGLVTAEFSDGTTEIYGNPFEDHMKNKINACIEAHQKGTRPVCTAETALPHVKLYEKVYHEIPIENFDADRIVEIPGFNGVKVTGLMDEINEAYREAILKGEDIYA